MFGYKLIPILNNALLETRGNHAANKLFYVIMKLSNGNIFTFRKLFITLGYDAVDDSEGIGVIHINEPMQAVFFGSKFIQPVDVIKNNFSTKTNHQYDDNNGNSKDSKDSKDLKTFEKRVKHYEYIIPLHEKKYQDFMRDEGLDYLPEPYAQQRTKLYKDYYALKQKTEDLKATIYAVTRHADRTEYYRFGKLHREDGPAIEYADGDKEWYINGARHREDGPAIEFVNGTKEWYINGESHREGGPAVECANGDKVWCINGKCHREDGPAVECANGKKYWYINGKELTEEEFNLQMKAKPIKLSDESNGN